MTSSASAISDALVANLASGSVFGVGGASNRTYQILETKGSSAAIVEFVGLTSSWITQTGWTHEWTFRASSYLKDTGNPETVLLNTLKIANLVTLSLESDPTVQGTVQSVTSITSSRTPGDALIVGGATWLVVPFEIKLIDW